MKTRAIDKKVNRHIQQKIINNRYIADFNFVQYKDVFAAYFKSSYANDTDSLQTMA